MQTDSSTLVVPLRVAALCVGAPDADRAAGQAPTADFARLPYASGGAAHNRGPYTSAVALARSGPFRGAATLPRGVHLHWTIPAGLAHAVQRTPGGPMEFPPVPDRWLVTRAVVRSTDGATRTRSWVVESDRLSPATTVHSGLAQPTVPVPVPPGPGFRYVGRSFDAASWTEVGDGAERISPLTAVGYGEPAFAAYYPDCSTVFGFHDALDDGPFDAETETVTYAVSGWYADPADDPLSGGDVAPGENPYGWTWSGPGTPKATVCAGAIGGVAWNPAVAFLAQDASEMTAAVAASPQEALSAMLADALARAHPGEDFSRAEPLLNALQFGLLSRPLTPDALESFEETVHAAGFSAFPGGSLWSVVSASDDSADTDGAPPLPPGVAAQLDALNASQLALDDLLRDLASRRRQLFADWYRYLEVGYLPNAVPPALRPALDDVRRYLRASLAEVAAIEAPGGAAEVLRRRVEAAASALSAALDPSLRLAADTAAPRFRQAADPVLVLSGPDAVPRGDPAAVAEAGGVLRCRTADTLVTSATLGAGLVPGSTAVTVAASLLPGVGPVSASVPGAMADALFRDACFWTPAMQPAVAAAAGASSSGGNPARADFAGTVAALRAAATAFVAGEPTGGVAYAGAAPAPRAAAAWAGTPWLPLVLQYDLAFGPVLPVHRERGSPGLDTDFILSRFAFDADEIDLVYRGPAPSEVEHYTGSVVLSAGAAVDLASALRRWIAGTGSDDPRVAEALSAVETMPLLAQGMDGATAAMLMRRQTLQMPVADPLAPRPMQGFVADVAAAVAGENGLAPLPQAGFTPVRTGTLAVPRVRIVDAFGRTREYRPRTVVARGLAAPPGLDVPASTAFLPPRITQPARLLFRWLAAEGGAEEAGAPAASPVLGWVLPDWLDRALALYTAGGTPLGALALSADGASVLWSVAPGGAWPLGTPLAEVMAGQEPELAAFAGALAAGGAAHFSALLGAVRHAQTFSLPERFREDVGTAVLLGQPLALARAALTLGLDGAPAADQSWASFTDAVLGGLGPREAAWDAGLSAVRFPVRLGAPAKLGDTLVGWWARPGGTTDYGTFFAPAATTWDAGVGPPADGALTVAPGASSAPAATVTMLFDPRGAVHATTGILPVSAVSIPPSQYADALRSLAVAFAAGPVLSGSNLPAQGDGPRPMTLVRPRVASGAWTWVTVADGAWASTDLVDAPGDQGTLSYSPQHVSDGWMVLTGPDTGSTS